jgi:hypothetical protein
MEEYALRQAREALEAVQQAAKALEQAETHLGVAIANMDPIEEEKAS